MSTLFFPKLVLIASLFAVAFVVTSLPEDEVQALRDIATTMGKKDWNFSVDPCSGQSGWVTPNPVKGLENNVTCDCSISNDTICHVISIVLKAQSLPGKLPPELIRFPYLQEIDLSRNYLNGTIPPEWGSMKLVKISILGNRVSGSIPKEIANISTLTSLTMEYNQLLGDLPQELGNLLCIERLFLTSNNLSGELPATLAKLITLKDFRISDNHFTGNIPRYIQNWTKLERLVIQASGLDGEIPSGIADLVNLTDLTISDLNGSEKPFPPLNNMKSIKTLILRSCNISGELPEYLGSVTTLKVIDLSFNKLSGGIPGSYSSLTDVDYIYLAGNLLNGTVPEWMLRKGDHIDLSYNNFTDTGSGSCQQRSVNLFGSSMERNHSGIVSCLRSFQCPKRLYYSLHINSGGKVTKTGDITYEDDIDNGGPAKFFQSMTNWAYSNTGHFLDDGRPLESYVWTNASRLSMNNPELYMTARLSPVSLTYYGFCLGNGNYMVDLHFAEIMFTDDHTYSSLGKRQFDVYIQGKLVLKDFDIAAEAGGVGKAIIKNFTAAVLNSTLEIRFYWAGKGTNGIPYRGVYGPLISAISVTPADFTPPLAKGGSSSLSVGAIVGIVVALTSLILLVAGLLWWKYCVGQRNAMTEDLRSLDLKTGSFTLRQIKAATNNFDIANKIGEGGFGSVYKGLLLDGTVIAVKQLSSKSKQGNREFVNEIGMISALQHPHLVKLYGCCIEGKELLLVYEYMENNSLARALFGPEEHVLELDWPTRQKICVGIARGLAYLHEESRLKIVHRDIKATNVLLDKDLNAKISDFGLAKLDEEDNTHISTRIAGTFGYMAPEYAMRGYLTDKADVYSFGIVVLEIVSGKSNANHRAKEECFNLLDWALMLKEQGSLMELVDRRLGSDFSKREVAETINVALRCADISPSVRPTMSSVVSILEGKSIVPGFVADPTVSDDGSKFETMKKHYAHSQEIQNVSTDVPSTVSSTSALDLYPIDLGSDYWENRDKI